MYVTGRKNEVASIMIAFVLLFAMFVFGPQTVMAQDAAHEGAANPPAGAHVPRHEPGHPARVKDLDVRVAAGDVSDPLAGNSTIIGWDKLAMVFHNYDGKFMRKTYDVDANLGTPVQRYRQGSYNVAGAGWMDMAAGYLGGPGWTDTVAAWEYPAGYISVNVAQYNSSLGISAERVLNTSDQVQGKVTIDYGALIRVATGDFDGDGYDEFVVAWEGASKYLNLRTYDTTCCWTAITAKGKIADEVLGDYKFLDVATGDFDDDGYDDIAVAWENASSQLVVKVYSYDRVTGNLVAHAKMVEAIQPGQISIAAGDFNGDAIDDIAVAFSTRGNSNLYLYQVTGNLSTLTKKATAAPASGLGYDAWFELAYRVLGVGAGDFNADGIDELALVYGAPGKWYCNVAVYSADGAFTLTPKATLLSSWLTAYGELSLAIGDLNRDSIAEIFAGSVNGAQLTDMSAEIGMFQVAPDLNTISQKGYKTGDEQLDFDTGHLAVAAGAYDGKSVRVGPPTYRRMAQTQQVLAVINEPPKHGDEINGTEIDINITDICLIKPCTYAKYETVEKLTTSMQTTTNRDWSVSEEVDLKFPHVKWSMKATYGESFEKTTTAFQSQEFGREVESDTDDVIVRLQQDLDVWEYPIYADGSDTVQGHLLVVWPVSTGTVTTLSGKNQASYYRPNHEVGNVMSYSLQAPGDISTTIKSDSMFYLGEAQQTWVKWSDVQDSEQKKTSKLDLESSLTLSKWGQHLTTEGKYSQGETSVNKVSFEQSTEIHVYFYNLAEHVINMGAYYGVQPYVYWAKPDGRLVLDYAVQPLTSDPGFPASWWQNTYNKPDPAFNLPWKEATDPVWHQLSKEISFAPTSAAPSSTVTVTAKVRNYSLVGIYNVPVHFYLGDPDLGGTPLPGGSVVARLNPMASATVSVPFNTSGHAAGETLKIYAVIGPLPAGTEEMHEENNKAYAQLPIVAQVATGPGDPASLYLAEGDIVVDPPTPSAGQTLHISATVHARSQTFDWVEVVFWDGKPLAGGKQIDGRLIPVILAGESQVADIYWPTGGSFGEHELWVTIVPHSQEWVTTDNAAHVAVSLAPYPYKQHLPAIYQQ